MRTLFLGDICPVKINRERFERLEVKTLFGDTVTLFENNELVFANLECAITDSEKYISKFGPALKAPKETAEVLAMLGVTVVGLSNNHIFDFGIRGYRDTVRALDESGIDYTGFGSDYTDSRENYIYEKDGERIAIIAVCEHEYSYALPDRMGSRPYDEYETIEDIRKAKAECDRVIVVYHGGKEHCRYPSPRLYKAAHAMARAGADVILGQHSHCISCYEEYEGCHILYGQGNFHFVTAQIVEDNCWNNSLAVRYDTKANRIEFIPVEIDGVGGIRLAKGESAEKIMSEFGSRNESLKDGTWLDGWHDFCVSMKELYYAVLSKAGREESTEKENHNFAHYLDCEAHTDVWRELFKTHNHTNEK